MRIERVTERGTGVRLRMFDGGQEVGYITEGVVAFVGFATKDTAARAAVAADRGLRRRRAGTTWLSSPADGYYVWDREDGPYVIARSGLLARLVAPSPGGENGWGFEVQLLPEERSSSVFAMSRARTMWQSLRGSGLSPRESITSARENDHVRTSDLPEGATSPARPVGAGPAAEGTPA